MQVVGSIIECQLILLAIQRKLSLADAVAPTTYQCRKVGLLSAGQLFNTIVTLNNVSNVSVFVGHHNGDDSSTIVGDCYFIAFTVTENVQIGFLTFDGGLEVFSLQTT